MDQKEILLLGMRRPTIELGGRSSKNKSAIKAKIPPKEKEEEESIVEEPSKPPVPIADLSYMSNYKMLEIYNVYFTEEELTKDSEEERELFRMLVASFVMKNYKLQVDEKLWNLLEIEIYSHDDPYMNLLIAAFEYHKETGVHPKCLAFFAETPSKEINGKFMIVISAIKSATSNEVIESRQRVFDYANNHGKNFFIKAPSLDEIRDYKFDKSEKRERIPKAPRLGLTFHGFSGEEQLKRAARHIMKGRSFCFEPHLLNEQKQILYAYQALRNGDGKQHIAEFLKVKPLKLEAWIRKFYKIEEILDPNRFLLEDFDWSNFEHYLKAFKYFTGLA